MFALWFRPKHLILLTMISALSGCNQECNNTPIAWAANISDETLADSWGTWKTHYQQLRPAIPRNEFKQRMTEQTIRDLSVEDFLQLHVENERVNRYPHAKTPEDMYPPHDRPRGDEDIAAVKYFMETCNPISPIVVAQLKDGANTRYIKLDGAHRLAAAALKKSKIRVVFVDL